MEVSSFWPPLGGLPWYVKRNLDPMGVNILVLLFGLPICRTGRRKCDK